MSWSRAFNDPIPLPRGRNLVTLNHADEHIQKRPKAEQLLDKWRARSCSWFSNSTRPTMMARIGEH